MEKFRFSDRESSEDLLAELVGEYLDEAKFIATQLFSAKDREGTTWNVLAFDDEAEEIRPGYEKRFLANLCDPIPHCGV